MGSHITEGGCKMKLINRLIQFIIQVHKENDTNEYNFDITMDHNEVSKILDVC
jgi:hypothetical protein